MEKRNWRREWQTRAVGMVVPLLALLVWQWVASAGLVHPQVLPAPLAVGRKWVEYLLPLQSFKEQGGANWWSWARLSWLFSGELVVDTLTSLYRVVAGFAIGGGLALPLGLAMITIGMLGLAIDIGMNSLNNYLLRWHRGLEH
jgi:NitT/TauT family transport system permease protein